MVIGTKHGRGWDGRFVILITGMFLREFHVQYTNFPSLSNTESVIVSAVILFCILGKQGEIKAATVVLRLPCSHNAALVGLMDEIRGGIVISA